MSKKITLSRFNDIRALILLRWKYMDIEAPYSLKEHAELQKKHIYKHHISVEDGIFTNQPTALF